MITPSLRRAVLYPSSPHAISRPAALTVAAAFPPRSHQRRQSSSKPPTPPNDGRTNVPSPSVKSVGTPRSKESAGEKRSGATSRLSRRGTSQDTGDRTANRQNEWAVNLPSVPSTQHLDPKDVFVASFFSNHRPMSVTSSVPLSAPNEIFQSIFTPKKPTSKSKPDSAEVIYTLASAVQSLHNGIAQSQNHEQASNSQRDQERSDLISALTQTNNSQVSTPSDVHHLDGSPQQIMPNRLPKALKIAIQQIARQFRPFNPPPAPQQISDAQIEAKIAENAAAAERNEHVRTHFMSQTRRERISQKQRHIISVSERSPDGRAYRFFTPHTTQIEHPQYLQTLEIEESGRDMHYDPRNSIMEPQRPKRMGRIREGVPLKSPGLRRQKLHTLSVKRQRRLKMKKHKYKKLLRRTRTLRRKLDK